MKTLLNGKLTKKHPDNNKDDRLEQLRAEMEAMRIQMLGKMALIQSLARGQEELRALVNKLHQDGCNRMKQTIEVGDQVINQPLMRQEVGLVVNGPFQIAATSRAQSQPRQQRQGNRRKRDSFTRKYTKLNIPIS